ncbi:MAG: hypothetical protein ACYCOU_12175 [Sulfobacillus sp.]
MQQLKLISREILSEIGTMQKLISQEMSRKWIEIRTKKKLNSREILWLFGATLPCGAVIGGVAGVMKVGAVDYRYRRIPDTGRTFKGGMIGAVEGGFWPVFLVTRGLRNLGSAIESSKSEYDYRRR